MKKVKVLHTLDAASIARIKEININKAREYYACFPAATKVWVALHTKLPVAFIADNWDAITK